MDAGRRRPATLIASTQDGREPAFRAQRLVADLPHGRLAVSSRSTSAASIGGRCCGSNGSGPGNNPPRPMKSASRRTASRVFVNLQGKHYLASAPRAGRETVEIRDSGSAPTAPSCRSGGCPREGGDYIAWTRDGSAVTWALGAQFFRQPLDASEPQKTGGGRRAAARDAVGVGAPHRRPDHHDERRRGDRERRRSGHPTTASPPSARRARSRLPPARAPIDVAGKTIMPGLVDAHSAHVAAARAAPDRGLAVHVQPRLRRDDAREIRRRRRRTCSRTRTWSTPA